MSRRRTAKPRVASSLLDALYLNGGAAMLPAEMPPRSSGGRPATRFWAWAVLSYLANYVDSECLIWQGSGYIAEKVGCSRTRVVESLYALEALGLIERVGRQHRATKYRVLPDLARAVGLLDSGKVSPRGVTSNTDEVSPRGVTSDESETGEVSTYVSTYVSPRGVTNGISPDGRTDGLTVAPHSRADARSAAPRIPARVESTLREALSWTGWHAEEPDLVEAWAEAEALGRTVAHLRTAAATWPEPDRPQAASRSRYLATGIRCDLIERDPRAVVGPPRAIPEEVQTSIETFAKEHGGSADAALDALGRFPADVAIEVVDLDDDSALCLIAGEACVTIHADHRFEVGPGDQSPDFPPGLLDRLGSGWQREESTWSLRTDPVPLDVTMAVLARVLRELATVWDEWQAA